MIRTRLAAAAAVALLGSSFAYAAEQVSHSSSIDWLATDWTGPNAQTLQFPKFDGSLGTLTSVVIELVGEVQGTATFKPLNRDAELTTLGLQTTFTINSSEIGSTNVIVSAEETWDTPKLVEQNETESVEVSDSHTEYRSFNSPADLSKFIGGVDDFLTFVVTSNTLVSNIWGGGGSGGEATTGHTSEARFAGKITYTYSYASVPEATTLVLGMAAGAPLLMHRGRRRRMSA